MTVLINNIQKKRDLTEAELNMVEDVLQFGLELHQQDCEMGVILVSNEYIQELNLKYRGIDQPTDVLSFAMNEEVSDIPSVKIQGEPILLGDVYISVERAMEQAESYGHSFIRELCYLGAHGLLHLLGYNHQKPEDTEKMRTEEERILEQFELGRNPL
ncbi:MAG: rRNA maturation RNase YbeY [Firmicutes bacterium]|nr:rRNA maturation RNase YbeY [Bacillota bacterium]